MELPRALTSEIIHYLMLLLFSCPLSLFSLSYLFLSYVALPINVCYLNFIQTWISFIFEDKECPNIFYCICSYLFFCLSPQTITYHYFSHLSDFQSFIVSWYSTRKLYLYTFHYLFFPLTWHFLLPKFPPLHSTTPPPNCFLFNIISNRFHPRTVEY